MIWKNRQRRRMEVVGKWRSESGVGSCRHSGDGLGCGGGDGVYVAQGGLQLRQFCRIPVCGVCGAYGRGGGQ